MKEGLSSLSQTGFLTLEEQLDAVLPELSNLEAQVAQYMRLNIGDLSFETGASLAEKVGVSEVTVSRLLRRLGYEGMRGLKKELRNQLLGREPPPISRSRNPYPRSWTRNSKRSGIYFGNAHLPPGPGW
jgi:DNA-binding MurR/RpiR family transcriptional regulator